MTKFNDGSEKQLDTLMIHLDSKYIFFNLIYKNIGKI